MAKSKVRARAAAKKPRTKAKKPANRKSPAKATSATQAKTRAKAKPRAKAKTPAKVKAAAKAKAPAKARAPAKAKVPAKAKRPAKAKAPAKATKPRAPARSKARGKTETIVVAETTVVTETTAVAESPTARETSTPSPGQSRGLFPADAVDASEQDPEIEALGLADIARIAAYALKRAHPAIKFTSGRRSVEDQARAMASNVVKNRKWIEQTYVPSPLRSKCQQWLDSNPDKRSRGDIEQGLLAVFKSCTDADLGKFSKHLSGQAFDIQPVDQDADAIKQSIRALQGLDKFLDKEGGLIRWHVQFSS